VVSVVGVVFKLAPLGYAPETSSPASGVQVGSLVG
jgi:hypothetical protein